MDPESDGSELGHPRPVLDAGGFRKWRCLEQPPVCEEGKHPLGVRSRHAVGKQQIDEFEPGGRGLAGIGEAHQEVNNANVAETFGVEP